MNLELAGAQVKCPNCGEIFFQTTDLYDPRAILRGEMLEWLPRYGPDGLNWSLPFAASDLSEAVICEGCGAPLAPTGFLGLERLHFPAGKSPAVENEVQRSEEAEKQGEEAKKRENEEAGKMIVEGNPEHESPVTDIIKEALGIPDHLKQDHCEECGKFLPYGGLEEHYHNVHPKKVLEDKKEENPGLEGSAPGDTKKTETKQAGRKGKGQSKAVVTEQQLPIEKVYPFPCALCEAGFEDEAGLKAHLAGHDMGAVQQASQD